MFTSGISCDISTDRFAMVFDLDATPSAVKERLMRVDTREFVLYKFTVT